MTSHKYFPYGADLRLIRALLYTMEKLMIFIVYHKLVCSQSIWRDTDSNEPVRFKDFMCNLFGIQ